jgi:hypothetical protein
MADPGTGTRSSHPAAGRTPREGTGATARKGRLR